ncbi:MAG: nicotinate-nucleotide adenylyltransferase [Chloroflexi bacterium]|nr:nicotinate-nucleotide adenylyltransferase [Chloroflexota bacterium]
MSAESAAASRLGILGGTFDPPHYGHLVLAENARVQLALDQVLFVLAGQPPHKPDRPITSVHHRLAMLQAAIEDNPGFVISRVDIERPGPHYTVETLALLHTDYPKADFFFLLGSDSLSEFAHWRDANGILGQTHLAVMQRPGYNPDLSVLTAQVPSLKERLVWVDAPHLDLASTDLRRRVSQRLPMRYLVPPRVEEYVRGHGLYLGEGG